MAQVFKPGDGVLVHGSYPGRVVEYHRGDDDYLVFTWMPELERWDDDGEWYSAEALEANENAPHLPSKASDAPPGVFALTTNTGHGRTLYGKIESLLAHAEANNIFNANSREAMVKNAALAAVAEPRVGIAFGDRHVVRYELIQDA